MESTFLKKRQHPETSLDLSDIIFPLTKKRKLNENHQENQQENSISSNEDKKEHYEQKIFLSNLFDKIKCKELIKIIFSFLSKDNVIDLSKNIRNKRIFNISLDYLKEYWIQIKTSLTQTQDLKEILANKLFLQPLNINSVEHFLSNYSSTGISQKSVKLSKYFLFDQNQNLIYSLHESRYFNTIQNGIVKSTIFLNRFRANTPFEYFSHFQFLSNYRTDIIAIFSLYKILLFNIVTQIIEKTLIFSGTYIYYNQLNGIFVILSGEEGKVAIVNDLDDISDKKFHLKLYENEINILEIKINYVIFYSTNIHDSSDLIVYNLSKKQIVSSFNKNIPGQLLKLYKYKNNIVAVYLDKCIFWKSDNSLISWEINCIINFEVIQTSNLLKEIISVNYLPEISPYCFLIFHKIKNENKASGIFYVFDKYKRHISINLEILQNLQLEKGTQFYFKIENDPLLSCLGLKLFQNNPHSSIKEYSFFIPKGIKKN